jgi:hypothetical protein
LNEILDLPAVTDASYPTDALQVEHTEEIVLIAASRRHDDIRVFEIVVIDIVRVKTSEELAQLVEKRAPAAKTRPAFSSHELFSPINVGRFPVWYFLANIEAL